MHEVPARAADTRLNHADILAADGPVTLQDICAADMTRQACALTCAAATPHRYVEDGDLWRWQVPGSKEFYSGLSLLSLEYDVNKNPGIFDTLVQLDPEELISKVRKGGRTCIC